MNRYHVCWLMALLGILWPLTAGAEPTAESILTSIVKSRLALKEGKIELQEVAHEGMRESDGPMAISCNRVVWFSGKKLRGDVTYPGYTEVSVFGSFPNGGHIFYSTKELKPEDIYVQPPEVKPGQQVALMIPAESALRLVKELMPEDGDVPTPKVEPRQQMVLLISEEMVLQLAKELKFFPKPKVKPGQRMALMISEESKVPPVLGYVPDPRWMGTIPMGLLDYAYFHPEEYFSSPAARAASVSAVDERGVPAWLLSWQEGESTRQTVVSCEDPARVLRSRQEFYAGGKKIVDEVSNSFDGPRDCPSWFPSTVAYSRHHDGRLERDELVKVVNGQLGRDVPDLVFTLRGIDLLPANTPVAWCMDHDRPCETGGLVWDGKEIVCVDQEQVERKHDK